MELDLSSKHLLFLSLHKSTKCNDYPPSLLALVSTPSNSAAEQICSVLRHGPFCVCETCLTQEVLKKKRRIVVSRCQLCGEINETNSQLSLHCKFTAQF
ncbi:hypothetical protein H5410_058617 [Solanum commersonii]|uniref:Uncharacterized protein n=1 Tax=Solanum commersonii TaxID=4109 RepID=A0A9J5WRC7_SOLCO|nr:hypothetical protein H5410_058617 [Solanum commersonii]